MRPHLFYPDADPFNDYDYAISQLAFDGLAQWSSPPPPVKTQPTRVLSLSNLHPSTSAELLEGRSQQTLPSFADSPSPRPAD